MKFPLSLTTGPAFALPILRVRILPPETSDLEVVGDPIRARSYMTLA